MCGIVYRKSLTDQNIARDVLAMYRSQRSRGIEGFGFYVPKRKQIVYNTQEQGIVKVLKKTKASEMLFHHRQPTSTANVLNACHPFKVTIDNNIYVVVHNGYLQNEDDLKKEHEKLGYKYRSLQTNGDFNDSEALAYDLALYLDGKQNTVNAKGAIAFIAIKNGKTVYFGRNSSSPLVYKLDNKNLTIRSEGKGITCTTDTLYRYENGKIKEKPLLIPDYSWQTWGTYNDPSNKYYDYEMDERLEELGYNTGLSDEAEELLLTFGLAKAIAAMQKLVDKTENEITQAWYTGNEDEALLLDHIKHSHKKILSELVDYKEYVK